LISFHKSGAKVGVSTLSRNAILIKAGFLGDETAEISGETE
jgi:hypothetical protein